MRSRLVTAALALLACCGAVFGMPQQTPPAEKSASTEPRKKEEPMAQALGHVRLLADRIEELRDPAGKIRALTSLGDTACRHDKGLAEIFFLRANDALVLVAHDEEDERARNPSKRPGFSVANDLRSQLVTAATQCDPEFAKQMRPAESVKPAPSQDGPSPDISAALRLLEEKKDEAAQLAARAMEGQPSDVTYQHFSIFLLRLRRQDPATADELFLTAVRNLRAQPKPSSYYLMALGNYPYSSFDVTKRPEFAFGFMLVDVGGVNVVNLQFTRPGNAPQTVRTYLEASLDLLSRPPADMRAQQLDYAAAYQLLPKARESAPDLAPAFELAMRRLEQSLPDKMKQDSGLDRLSQSFIPSDEENESELEDTSNPQRRQRLIYLLATAAWDKGNFARARKFASDLEHKEFRAQFLSAIDYAEAAKAVEEGRLDAALALGKDFPAGFERSLLQTVLAAAQLAKGDSKAAFSLLDEAQRDAEKVSLSMRPTLLVAITSVLVRVDRDAALELLTRAVTAFNERDKTEKPGETVRVFTGGASVRGSGRPAAPEPEAYVTSNSTGFSKAFYFQGSFRSLALKTKGIEAYELNAKLLRLFSADAERAEAILSQLQDEARLGPALAALAAAYLDAAKVEPAKAPEKQ